MFIINPYAQAGWSNPANAYSINNTQWTSDNPPAPSVYGALPFSHPSASFSVLTFQFCCFSPNILNSTILGPGSNPCFLIASGSDPSTEGITYFQNYNGKNFAAINWKPTPVVEIANSVSRRMLTKWMPLAFDGNRQMKIMGTTYVWAPRGRYLCLYSGNATGVSPPELLARVSSDDPEDSISLEMSASAIQKGLLEACIVAVTILQSGRVID